MKALSLSVVSWTAGVAARSRASRLTTAATILLMLIGQVRAVAADFGFDDVRARAQALAGTAYAAPKADLPAWMQSLNYSQHQSIRFNPAHAWWHGEKLPFQLQFFHPGWLFQTSVKINEVVDGRARPIAFSRDLFDYGSVKT